MITRTRSGLRSVVALAAIIVMVVAWAPLVSAEVVPGPPGVQATANPPTSTVELIGVGSGQGVNGFMSNLTPPQRLAGYPTTIDPAWPANNVGFAGLIRMKVTSGPGAGATFEAYCIDVLTPTNVGYDYKRGEWSEANIDNVGYVAQLLQSYSPTTDLPAGLNANEKAAAVQAAIWYFSDGYVLPLTPTSFYKAVVGIVSDVITRGPLTAPPPPTVTVAGPLYGMVDTIIGPFVVDTDGKAAIGTLAPGVEAFSDAAGTPLAAPFPVTDGKSIWLRSAQPGIEKAALTVTAVATTPGGAVYLYVPPQSNPNARAQTIIQAGPLTAETAVNRPVAFLTDDGQFPITKSITGAGAGQQGPITIEITCAIPNGSIPPFTIPGGTPAGTVTTLVTGITAPTRCTVTETASGDHEEIDVFAEPTAAASRAASRAAVGPRRHALRATQQLSVCPAPAQPLSAPVGGELQSSPGVNFENHVEPTTPTTPTTTTQPITSTPTIPTTVSTTTAPTTPTIPTTVSTTGATTTAATTTGATTTAATTTGATTSAATTTGATTIGATTTAAAVVPTTAVDECEFAGDTTTPATTGPETLPATGSSGSGLIVGLIGLVGGLGLVALASRRRFFE